MPLRGQRLMLAMVATAAAFTVATILAPFIHFAYRSPSAHLVLETAAALIALLAAYLVFGRFEHTRSAGDLVLVYALSLFGSTNLFFAAIPSFFRIAEESGFSVWAPTTTRVLAAAAFTTGALLHGRRLPGTRGAARLALAATAATLTGVAAAVAAVAPFLPDALDPAQPPSTTAYPTLTGHPALIAAQVASGLLFAAAAIGFSRRASRTGDDLLHLLAAGAVLAAFARAHYALFPSLYSEWVYTGDVLRLGFYLLLVAGAAGEIRRHWESRTEAAVLEERRRVARDLHDGLAQELALISRQSRRLLGRHDPELVRELVAASGRALAESRRAVASLARSDDEPLGSALAEASQRAASRFGARVVLDVARGFDLPAGMREELVRIASEAVTNAGRHGRASVIRVELASGARRLLKVRDNGTGFDPAAAGGFGITSMYERARVLGGELRLSSSPGLGTEVEVTLP